MKRTTKYAGLDVHQATTVIVVREESARVIARAVLPTNAMALTEFFCGIRGSLHVTFEEGTQAQWLYELLEPLVERVVVCNRRETRRQGNKSDWHDAEELAELLRRDAVRPVYHDRAPQGAELKELGRTYVNLVEDGTRVMARLKALFRARAIPTRGHGVYSPGQRVTWLAQLPGGAVRFRAEALYAELEVMQQLRGKAKVALITAARRHPAWSVLRAIPFLGPVRVALLLAFLQTPWRFRTKRNLWAYAGLAVTTRITAEYQLLEGRTPVRRRRTPLTRGLNRNHHPLVKAIFKSAATAATAKPGAFQDFYQQLVAHGMREELARVTLTRKLAALTLRLWKTGEAYDPAKLTRQAC
jgi:transposase